MNELLKAATAAKVLEQGLPVTELIQLAQTLKK
jgi:hypothetical protein